MGLKETFLGTRTKPRKAKVALTAEQTAMLDGEELWVRAMSAGQLSAVEQARMTTVKVGDKFESKWDLTGDRQRVVARCLCDETGTRVFADDDAAAIGELDGELVDAVYEAAIQLNGMQLGGKKKKSALEEDLEKNSPGPTGASLAA